VPDTLSVGELVELFRGYYPRPRTVADIVELAGIGDFLRKRYGKLSGGQQRRAQFALAIAGSPEILFLVCPVEHLAIQVHKHFCSHSWVSNAFGNLSRARFVTLVEHSPNRILNQIRHNLGRRGLRGFQHGVNATGLDYLLVLRPCSLLRLGEQVQLAYSFPQAGCLPGRNGFRH